MNSVALSSHTDVKVIVKALGCAQRSRGANHQTTQAREERHTRTGTRRCVHTKVCAHALGHTRKGDTEMSEEEQEEDFSWDLRPERSVGQGGSHRAGGVSSHPHTHRDDQ